MGNVLHLSQLVDATAYIKMDLEISKSNYEQKLGSAERRNVKLIFASNTSEYTRRFIILIVNHSVDIDFNRT